MTFLKKSLLIRLIILYGFTMNARNTCTQEIENKWVEFDMTTQFWVWEKCKSYCSWKLINKTCGRINMPCRNVKNADEEYQKKYHLAYSQACISIELQKVLQQIADDNEAISHIY